MYDERRTIPIARFALTLGVLSLAALASAGPLHHLGALSLKAAFLVLAAAVIGALIALVSAAIAVVVSMRRRARQSTAMAALALALIAIASLGAVVWKAAGVPPIHDVTTDTDNPPQFVAVLPLRAGALNAVEYGGPETAARQHKSYADIAPLTLTVPPPAAFDRALATARAMGWDLVASDPAAGRIEATDTTFWFGFKDDVVIRVAEAPGGSRVDVRSLSRVGGGDLGANAARIRKYLKTLGARTHP